MAKRFTIEQRNEIIDLHLNQGYSTRALSKEFGIGRTTIQNWLRSYRKETNTNPMPNNVNGKPKTKVQPAKMMMLKEIKMQMEVLEVFQKELERWDPQD